MKSLLNFIKTKLLMIVLAFVLPFCATTVALSFADVSKANAESNTTTYYGSYTSEVSLTNSNFNSSSSNYSLSTSLSGWTGQVQDKKTTAGTISTGSSFQTYMTSTFHLSNNPGAARTSDQHILMINSQTSDSGKYDTARQGYKSSNITLSANSFYSFQASFKNDTNYNSNTEYDDMGTISESDKYLAKSTFEGTAFSATEPVYLAFTYRSANYYLKKELSSHSTLAAERTLTSTDIFYEDTNYIGFLDTDETPIYVEKTAYVEGKVAAGTQTYTCGLAYDKTNKRYNIATGTTYYKSRTAYTSLNDYTFGSMYLSGLKDDNGNDVKADFVRIASKNWVTYYFFVATGSTSQTVNLELWLGSKTYGQNSSGVVFFDDCHIYQYSENAFWKKYKEFANKSYSQEIISGGVKTTETYNCTKLVDLRNDESLDFSGFNFDFENGEYAGGAQPVSQWTKTGSGNARVFNVDTPEFFKTTTGYDFVGSDMTCVVELGEPISLTKNQYVLALWSNDNTVKITSNDIEVDANTIYKVTAFYKTAELSSGNAYMFVSENDNVLSAYNLSKSEYNVTAETPSAALSSNGSNNFINNYSTVEFYIKGNALYNSSVNISLGLGNGSETATGCVVFDDIKIEKASSADYSGASNKIAIGSFSGSTSVTNGNFNSVTLDKSSTAPYSADGWTVESSDDFTFAGVINTSQASFDKYVAAYNKYRADGAEATENPYYWASYASSPKNVYGSLEEADNVYMLANIQSAWQTLKSPEVNLAKDSTAKLSFNYKTAAKINVRIYDGNGILLYEVKNLTSDTWTQYEIYFKSFSGASNVYAEIDLGTSTEKVSGFAYFDNFAFDTVTTEVFAAKAETAEGNSDIYGVVDLSNFYLNLPTTDFAEGKGGAYTETINGASNHGELKTTEDLKDSTIFKIEDEDKVAFYFNNQVVGSYALTSKYTLDLTAGYHTLTFKTKTYFAVAEEDLDKDTTYSYGVTVGLTGYDYVQNIRCDDEYQTYTIYLNVAEDTTANLYISFVSDHTETIGSAVVYDIALADSTSDEYDAANDAFTAKEYDLNSDRVFVAKAASADEEEQNEEEENAEKDTDTNSSSNGDLNWSLIISGAITGLAIIIAVVFSLLKNVKVKKIEVKRKESYDRRSSLELDALKKRAEQKQKEDAAKVQENLDKLQAELDRLEKEHKQKVVALREQDKDKVSKTTDKEFKDFAKKSTVLSERIESLKTQIENIKSPDYLLGLERKLASQDEAQKRAYKKQAKLNEKQNNKK